MSVGLVCPASTSLSFGTRNHSFLGESPPHIQCMWLGVGLLQALGVGMWPKHGQSQQPSPLVIVIDYCFGKWPKLIPWYSTLCGYFWELLDSFYWAAWQPPATISGEILLGNRAGEGPEIRDKGGESWWHRLSLRTHRSPKWDVALAFSFKWVNTSPFLLKSDCFQSLTLRKHKTSWLVWLPKSTKMIKLGSSFTEMWKSGVLLFYPPLTEGSSTHL